MLILEHCIYELRGYNGLNSWFIIWSCGQSNRVCPGFPQRYCAHSSPRGRDTRETYALKIMDLENNKNVKPIFTRIPSQDLSLEIEYTPH